MSDNLITKLANPAPLGLLGFGVTTVLLNLANAGAIPLDTVILAMGIAYGGLAQVIVGIMEFRKGNTFGTVAFLSYGLFWWSLVTASGFTEAFVPQRIQWSLFVFAGSLFHNVGNLYLRHVLWYIES